MYHFITSAQGGANLSLYTDHGGGRNFLTASLVVKMNQM